jgi:hypothetical protein
MMFGRSWVAIAIVVTVGSASIWADQIDAEPVIEEQCRMGTVRRLKGREIWDLWVRRARCWRMVRCVMMAALTAGLAKWIWDVWAHEGLTGYGWMCLGVTVKGFEVVQNEEVLEIRYPEGSRLLLTKGTAYWDQMADVEMVRLLLLRDGDGRKVFNQAEVGELFGLSRQMTNRRKRLVEETQDLGPLVKREYEKSVLTDAVMNRIAEIVAQDWWKADEEIAEQLLSEGMVRKISAGTVRKGLSRIDGRLLRKAVRDRVSQGDGTAQMCQGYLVKRLLRLVEEILHLGRDEHREQYLDLKNFAEKTQQERSKRGRYRRDVEQEPVYAQQSQGRRKNILRMAIEEGWDMFKERPVCCPDCLSVAVRRKQRRPRTYKNGGCRVEEISSEQYVCNNPDCSTRTFTKLPNHLERWAQADFFLKRKVFALVFHVRGSFRRSVDYVCFETNGSGPAWTTALEWIRKAGREAVRIDSILPIRWSGVLGLDEKWVKRFGEWVYIYEAIDIETGLPILKRVFPECNGQNARAVLLEIKARGYLPKTIVTDLIANYDKPIQDIFPNAVHQKCLFHAEKDARKLVRTYLPTDANKATRRQLYILLRDLFSTTDTVDLQSQITRLLWAREHFPSQAAPVFNMVERIAPCLSQAREDTDIPTTNNATESAIKEFDALYRTTYGYSSIPALQDFLDAYTIYLCFRKYASGPHKGLCPLEVAGHDIRTLDWDFYLLAG